MANPLPGLGLFLLSGLIGACGASGVAPTGVDRAPRQTAELRGGRLVVAGNPVFLKIGKPLRDFANADDVDRLIADLPVIRAKHYNCLEINCYWHHFDSDGDGVPEASLDPLNRLIRAIGDAGMYPCLSVETYGVGGGQIPEGFWKAHPDAIAIDDRGDPVRDTEYGFGTAVPSILSPAYREASRRFIRELTAGVDHQRLLYFETTVEPQFMGQRSLDFSANGRLAYEEWLRATGLDGPAWPDRFPVPASFSASPVWKRFRAESLADWVNGDAAAFRDVAGPDAWIAVDYLETCGDDMANRNGDSVLFLERLTCANIVQVNWSWNLAARSPNLCAYRNVHEVMKRTGRDWAVSEHMTLNGSDFGPAEVPAILRNTLRNGTHFGWEFVSLSPATDNSFALYNDDWSPKPTIAVVDEQWDRWMDERKNAEAR